MQSRHCIVTGDGIGDIAPSSTSTSGTSIDHPIAPVEYYNPDNEIEILDDDEDLSTTSQQQQQQQQQQSFDGDDDDLTLQSDEQVDTQQDASEHYAQTGALNSEDELERELLCEMFVDIGNEVERVDSSDSDSEQQDDTLALTGNSNSKNNNNNNNKSSTSTDGKRRAKIRKRRRNQRRRREQSRDNSSTGGTSSVGSVQRRQRQQHHHEVGVTFTGTTLLLLTFVSLLSLWRLLISSRFVLFNPSAAQQDSVIMMQNDTLPVPASQLAFFGAYDCIDNKKQSTEREREREREPERDRSS
jgi:hypothetical protein